MVAELLELSEMLGRCNIAIAMDLYSRHADDAGRRPAKMDAGFSPPILRKFLQKKP